jgi:hypothetical protein
MKKTIIALVLMMAAYVFSSVIIEKVFVGGAVYDSGQVQNSAEKPFQNCAEFHKSGFAGPCLDEIISPLPPDDLNSGIKEHDFTGNWTLCALPWRDSCDKSKNSDVRWLMHLEINSDYTYSYWESYKGEKDKKSFERGSWMEEWRAIWKKDKWIVSNVMNFQPRSRDCGEDICDISPWTINIKNERLMEVYEYDELPTEEYSWEKE